MSKAQEATAAIKAALKATSELVNTTSIYLTSDLMQVHVSDMRDLEQVPGKVEYNPFMPEDDYPWEAYKEVDGVRFFTLLTQEEYEGLES